jgi:hypothetical protein
MQRSNDTPLGEIYSSVALVEKTKKHRNSVSLLQFYTSSWIPTFRFLKNAS